MSTQIDQEDANTTQDVIDSGEGRIRPRARLIRTIGAELISSETVAVVELVRNSYDADATRVEIRFSDPHLPGQATLEIADNGHGMTREILLGPWMEPATDFKSAEGSSKLGGEYSPRGRRRLGSKGVGRFAAQRLGRSLIVRTMTAGHPHMIEADFDWDALDRPERYLDELSVPWREVVTDQPDRQGTTLQMGLLRDHWTPERFDRLRVALARLIGPGLGDDAFELCLVINGAVEVITPTISNLKPMYMIEGSVFEGGQCEMSWSDIAGGTEEWERTVMWPAGGEVCGPFRFKICAWDLDREALDFYFERTNHKQGLRDFRNMIREHSGVSLYRDGFRILPYGEPDNDWLRLDRRRVNNPTLRMSNNQILGFIQLTAAQNPGLRDQTNREGLVANDSYQHLYSVVLELLTYLETRRFSARRALSLGLRPATSTLPGLDSSTTEQVERALERMERGGAAEGGVQEIRTLIEQHERNTTDALRQYAGLAASGQLSGLVFAQLGHPLRQIKSELRDIRDEIEDFKVHQGTQDDLQAGLGRIEEHVATLLRIIDKLDPLAVVRKNRKKVQVSLRACIEDVFFAMQSVFDAHNIVCILEGDLDVEVNVDPAALQQATALVLQNAVKALSMKGASRRLNIQIAPGELRISNNGPPIPVEHVERIFEAHFTTWEDAAGMGLTLARDLLTAVGASIELYETSPTCFLICFAAV